MNITINNFNTNRYNQTPCFKSSIRTVKNAAGEIRHRNTTNMFRQDLPWSEMIDLFEKKYANIPKVNIVCYGCSDGSEPISLAMLLIDRFGENAKKFFPIIAKDIDPYIIMEAKSNLLNIETSDLYAMDSNLKNDFGIYVEKPEFNPWVEKFQVEIKPIVQNKIRYSVADIRTDLQSIPKDNTIVFARNFWPYLKDEKEVFDLAKQLHSTLGKNCLVAVGNFDSFVGIRPAMICAGFESRNLPKNFYMT